MILPLVTPTEFIVASTAASFADSCGTPLTIAQPSEPPVDDGVAETIVSVRLPPASEQSRYTAPTRRPSRCGRKFEGRGRVHESPLRRYRHRSRPGRTADGGAARKGGQDSRCRRVQAPRRNLRERGLHAHQDSGRERLCGPSRPARRRLRSQHWTGRRQFRGCHGAHEEGRR